MASNKRELEKRIEELDDEVEEQSEQIQLLEHVCPFTLLGYSCIDSYQTRLIAKGLVWRKLSEQNIFLTYDTLAVVDILYYIRLGGISFSNSGAL